MKDFLVETAPAREFKLEILPKAFCCPGKIGDEQKKVEITSHFSPYKRMGWEYYFPIGEAGYFEGYTRCWFGG